MLRVTTNAEEGQGKVTLKLEGKLAGPWVEEFERCWSSTSEKWKQVVVELAGVTFIDSKGKCLLAKIHDQGAKLVGTGLMTRSIIEEISHCDEEQKRSNETAQGAKQTLVKMLVGCSFPCSFLPGGRERKRTRH